MVYFRLLSIMSMRMASSIIFLFFLVWCRIPCHLDVCKLHPSPLQASSIQSPAPKKATPQDPSSLLNNPQPNPTSHSRFAVGPPQRRSNTTPFPSFLSQSIETPTATHSLPFLFSWLPFSFFSLLRQILQASSMCDAMADVKTPLRRRRPHVGSPVARLPDQPPPCLWLDD